MKCNSRKIFQWGRGFFLSLSLSLHLSILCFSAKNVRAIPFQSTIMYLRWGWWLNECWRSAFICCNKTMCWVDILLKIVLISVSTISHFERWEPIWTRFKRATNFCFRSDFLCYRHFIQKQIEILFSIRNSSVVHTFTFHNPWQRNKCLLCTP